MAYVALHNLSPTSQSYHFTTPPAYNAFFINFSKNYEYCNHKTILKPPKINNKSIPGVF